MSYWYLFDINQLDKYAHNIALGSIIGFSIPAVILTFNPSFLILTSMIGGGYGAIYTAFYNLQIKKSKKFILDEQRFIDKDFDINKVKIE